MGHVHSKENVSLVLSAQCRRTAGRQKPVRGTHNRTRCSRNHGGQGTARGVLARSQKRAAQRNGRQEEERVCGSGGPWA